MSKQQFDNYASVVRHFSVNLGDDAMAAKAGYDLLMGVQTSTAHLRYKAWKRYLEELQTTHEHTTELRDGIWVPAIEEDSL